MHVGKQICSGVWRAVACPSLDSFMLPIKGLLLGELVLVLAFDVLVCQSCSISSTVFCNKSSGNGTMH